MDLSKHLSVDFWLLSVGFLYEMCKCCTFFLYHKTPAYSKEHNDLSNAIDMGELIL